MREAVLLNAREQLFINYYLSSQNASNAVIKAGYKTKYPNKYAYLLLNKPKVKSMIEQTKAQIDKNRRELDNEIDIPTFKDIALSLKAIVDNAKKDSNKIAAIRELNAMLGFLAPTKSIHANIQLDVNKVQEMTNKLLESNGQLVIEQDNDNDNIDSGKQNV